MATRYDEILRRDRRRASGLPVDEDDQAPASRYDAILARDAEREASRQAEQQAAQVSRARTITRPSTTAAPSDALSRGLDPATPGGDSGFRGAGGGYDNWDDGTGFFRNLGRYAADAAGPGFVQNMGATLRTVGDVLPETQSFDNGFKLQWEQFIRHVVVDAPWPHTLREGAKGVQLAELALQSWRERRWIDVPYLPAEG